MYRIAPLLALLAALTLVACGDKAPTTTGGGGEAEHDHHEGKGPNGGSLGEVGDHVAHLEMIVDHGRHAVIAHVLTADNKAMRIKDAPVLNLVFKSGPKQITGKAVDANADGATEWHFRDELLAGEPESGKFRIVIGGTPYTVALAHDHDHEGHDHDEHEGHDHDEEGHEDHDHDDDDHDHDHDKKDGDK
jgi:hypothetical protein